ncbi:glycosyltransferase family 9 protein [Actinopolyspora saharensis]|uniref:ADP-heptose:LPS heptosyltransferase n=1 Tax=Actinopolyspora saharensis TaxID=995062 RepID=A0A1H0ZHQ8_9ACTN|nr:glycosyltransferase family 9 protein [Actinopolyspora saharensis]SDQ26656.1 ADP-heptose:LPS heptosyltransferase [Actinopolyspora saharensis]
MAVSSPDSVFVLRALGIGDLLTGVPALRGLRRAWPDSRLVLAAPRQLAELVALTGAVDVLWHATGPEDFEAPVPPPGVAVNLHGSGPESVRALCRLGAEHVLSHAHPVRPELDGPAWQPDQHETRRWCRMLEHFGIGSDSADLGIARPGTAGPAPGAVVVHPGASHAARRWPAERYAALADGLAGTGRDVVVSGSGAERALAERVASSAGLPADSVLAGDHGLTELAALVANAELLVCGDTGVAHLATAYGTPSVVLFGPVSPEHWGPPSGGAHIALWTGHHGDTFADRPDSGLLEITVDRVAEAATSLLSSYADSAAS